MRSNIKNVWTVLAQSSSIDKDNNSLSIFDILEEVNFQVAGTTPEKFALPLNTHLITLWERLESGVKEDLNFKIVLRDPKHKILLETEGVVKMEAHHKRYRFRAQFHGMPITEPGVYRFDVINGEEVLGSTSFEIKMGPPPVKSPISL